MVTAFFLKLLQWPVPLYLNIVLYLVTEKTTFSMNITAYLLLIQNWPRLKQQQQQKYFNSGPRSTSTLLCVAASVYIQQLPDSIASQNFLDLIVQWEPIFLFYSTIYSSIFSNRPMIASCVTLFCLTTILLSSLALLRVVFVLVGQYMHWWITRCF